MKQKHLHNIALFVVCIIAFIAYLKYSGIGSNPDADLMKLMNGTAVRPFQYRILVPVLVNMALSIFPENAFSSLNVVMIEPAVARLAGNLNTGRNAAWLAIFCMFFSLVGSVFVIKLLMERLGYPLKTINVLTLVFPISLLAFLPYAYIYDLPNLFLFSCALLALAPNKEEAPRTLRSWFIYLTIFVLASLNKETSILLLVAFSVVYYQKLNRARFIQLAVIQIVVYGIIRLYLLDRFSQNPGIVAAPLWWLYISYPMISIVTMAFFSAIVVLIKREWAMKPLFLRQSFMMAIPLTGLFLLFGYPFEFRTFFEVYPILFLLILPQHVMNPPS
jgi:hypothetical protein